MHEIMLVIVLGFTPINKYVKLEKQKVKRNLKTR